MPAILKEIIDQCSSLEIYERRSSTESCEELVFYNKDIAGWNKILTDILGPAIKPKGTKATNADQNLTKAYGGIREDQVLFKQEKGGTAIIAMLWPWQDEIHTTLKIILLQPQQRK